MDNTRFTVVFSNHDIYKEVELNKDMKMFKAGTTSDSDIKFNSEAFMYDFQILFINKNGIWSVISDEGSYFNYEGEIGGNRNFTNKELLHGDEFTLRFYSDSRPVLKVDFKIDFSSDKNNYDMKIDVKNITSIKIGAGKKNNICIMDELLGTDFITLTRDGDRFFIIDNNTRYGVYVNGNRVYKHQQIYDTDFFTLANYSFYYKEGILYTSHVKNVFLNGLIRADFGVLKSSLEYPQFNRNTRIKTLIPNDKISILDPPMKPEKPKSNIVLSLLPVVCSLVITIFMRVKMSNQGSTYILLSAATMGIGAVTTIISLIERKKEYKRSSIDREAKYNDYIARKKSEIEKLRKDERNLLNEQYRDMKKNIDCVNEFSGDLFDRECNDNDFLAVRLGTGIVEAKQIIDYKKQEKFESEDELANLPEEISENYKNIERAPIIIDLKECNAIGVVGDRGASYEIMKNMTLDICIRQYYNDVRVFYIIEEKSKSLINWVRFMPHVQNPYLNRRNIVADEESKNVIFEYLFNEFGRREQNKGNTIPRFIIFIFDEMGIKSHPVSKYIEKASSLGATFVFFETNKDYLPLYCNQLIYAYNNNKATVTSSHDRNSFVNFQYSIVEDSVAEKVAIKLAPVFCEEVSLESTLTKNISLYELLNVYNVSDLDLMSRWRNSQVDKSMAAPLGVKTKEEIVYLDLHEKYHGPHGLVAGTTGSGKSEILQSYILSMATLFHPYEVSFVIIDFKGGGMVNQFKDLPHLVGAITNIDGKAINRSLLSIKAELMKRQNLFHQANVNHIDKYIKLFKSGAVNYPLPHLIIIVDEFAELKAEQPEFMKELISAARIGRSLGVHLILATQKPSGQVDDQIWSNSKFKLCLKVQTKEDSNEVLKSTLAAEITEPGRAYLQVGNNEIFELFQSAYSGAPANMVDSGKGNKEFSLAAIDFTGKRNVIYKKKSDKSDGEVKSQLMAIVDYVHDFCESNNIRKLPDICLPALPGVINFPEADKLKPVGIEMLTELGMFDDPECQNQDIAAYELAVENTLIIGSARYGKTNMLQTIIKSLAMKYSPDDINIYIIDFASMVLKNFEGLSHVGGVVCSSDDEKLRNLMKLLNSEIVERKERMMSVGVSSFVSYKEAGYTDYPQIVVMIDNMTVLKELYFQDDSQLLSLCREGLAVGISFIIANASTAGFGYRYLSNFSRRIALFCNDSGEYSTIFDYCKNRPEDKPGRFIMEMDKRHLECQAYLAFEGEKEFERVNAMKEFIADINEKYADSRAKMIPVIPKVLNDKYVDTQLAHFAKRPFTYIAGLDYGNVMPYVFNLDTSKPLAMSGRSASGKSNFIKCLVSSLDKRTDCKSDIFILDNVAKKLKKLEELDSVKMYAIGTGQTENVLTQVEQTLATRYEKLTEGDDHILDDSSLQVIIFNDYSIMEAFDSNSSWNNLYSRIISKYKDMKVFVILGNIPNASISYSAPDILKNVRENKNLLFFDDLNNLKIYDLAISQIREFSKPIEMGDCYHIMDNSCRKIKTTLKTINNR